MPIRPNDVLREQSERIRKQEVDRLKFEKVLEAGGGGSNGTGLNLAKVTGVVAAADPLPQYYTCVRVIADPSEVGGNITPSPDDTFVATAINNAIHIAVDDEVYYTEHGTYDATVNAAFAGKPIYRIITMPQFCPASS